MQQQQHCRNTKAISRKVSIFQDAKKEWKAKPVYLPRLVLNCLSFPKFVPLRSVQHRKKFSPLPPRLSCKIQWLFLLFFPQIEFWVFFFCFSESWKSKDALRVVQIYEWSSLARNLRILSQTFFALRGFDRISASSQNRKRAPSKKRNHSASAIEEEPRVKNAFSSTTMILESIYLSVMSFASFLFGMGAALTDYEPVEDFLPIDSIVVCRPQRRPLQRATTVTLGRTPSSLIP